MTTSFAAVRVLCRRDVLRFFREKTRIVGALIQPLLFWWVIGSGMAGSFRIPGQTRLSYLEYFFPGIVLMVILFSSMFATISVIEDRHSGFLQSVLVAPVATFSVVFGKSLGGSFVALIQAVLFILLAPIAGFPFAFINWLALFAAMFAVALSLNSIGFAVAWWLDSVQGYHVIMSLVLLPAWVLSGAVFPLPEQDGWLRSLIDANPLSYALFLMRRALGAAPTHSPDFSWAVMMVFAAFSLCLATLICSKRR